MPSTYAHFRFGLDTERRLPDRIRRLTGADRQVFQIGFHGPDLLFHYHPLKKNPVSRLGYEDHERTGRDFFGECRQVLTSSFREDSPEYDAALVYLLGVTCHFALDRACHPCVAEAMKKYGFSHNGIESQFERALMVHDGLDPLTHRVADHMIPTMENARVIGPFYRPASDKQILAAIRGFVTDANWMIPESEAKIRLVDTAFRLTGKNYAELSGLMTPRHHDRRYTDTNRELYRCYQEALSDAPDMVMEMGAYLTQGGELDQRFDHTFGEN